MADGELFPPESTKTEYWGLVEILPKQEDTYDVENLKAVITMKTPNVKGEFQCSHNICEKPLVVLKMTGPSGLGEEAFRKFLNKFSPYASRNSILSKQNRSLTERGKGYLENGDIPLPIGLFLEFVKDGYPVEIIKEISQMGEKKIGYIDRYCKNRGYVQVLK